MGVGYHLGTLTSSNPAATPSADTKEPILEPKEEEKAEDVNKDEDEELEDIPEGDLGSISAGFLEPCKLVCLPRSFAELILFTTDIGSRCSYRS